MIDFNDAPSQETFIIIPDGTIATVRMSIKPGHDSSRGHDNWATKSKSSDSVFLACKFTVLEGAYNARYVFSNIGLYSPKGPAWEQQGRAFMKAALNSAHGIAPKDKSPAAQDKRRISGYGDLDGLVFMVTIGTEADAKGQQRNTIKNVIEPGHSKYICPTPKVAAPTPNVEYVECTEESYHDYPF